MSGISKSMIIFIERNIKIESDKLHSKYNITNRSPIFILANDKWFDYFHQNQRYFAFLTEASELTVLPFGTNIPKECVTTLINKNITLAVYNST